ncbi:cation/H(+) antiporter 15-like [Hibiscus syriacus]|uniref:cation/H(+) antiporter 15-like n=1 Tax=Hibiscus syriacus TaxID=106335 RepID=UPI001920C597|nr:cation/H(+) antiporter 15-like [Hibiscus syriacus]
MDGSGDQCLILNITANNGIYLGDNPFNEPLPNFITQLAAILITTRFLYHLFKPLHQPRIVSEVLGGLLLGPSALGNTNYFADLFPTNNVVTLETFAQMSLVLHMFLVGLELDLSSIGRINKKAMTLVVIGLFLPFMVWLVFFYLLHGSFAQDEQRDYNEKCDFLWAGTLTVTSFQAVNRILSDLKLLNSEIGRLARPIALISDLGSWILTVMLIPFCANSVKAPFVIIATIAGIFASFYTIRPLLAWIVHHTSNHSKSHSDVYLCFPLVSAILSGFITDSTGIHPIVGAFVFGLIMPDELTVTLMDRFDYFISRLMLPVFFAVSGLRVDIFKITKWSLVFIFVIMFSAAKIIVFVLVSVVSNVNTRDSFALGLLMSTKGTWAILLVATGLEKGVLHDGDYAVMVVAILLMNCIVAPTIATIYKRSNLFVKYNSRTIQDAKPEAEFRILICVHSYCDVPGMLKLLHVSHDPRYNRKVIFTLHLVEISDRQSTMLIVHNSHTTNNLRDHASSETDRTITAFSKFKDMIPNVRIQSLTISSPFMALDGDICSIAKDKAVTFIILPFHKRAGSMNQKVLFNAPCSVGIFVNRGLEEANVTQSDVGIHEIAMLFLGGADDCEALAYAWKMAAHPGVSLTVIRLIETDFLDYSSKENEQDDDYIHEFRYKTADEELIIYQEKELHSGEELIDTLKDIENKFELFIVGRRDGLESPITTQLFHMIECPDLGVIGNLLAKSESSSSSVLVVQQFRYLSSHGTQMFQKRTSRLERRNVKY